MDSFKLDGKKILYETYCFECEGSVKLGFELENKYIDGKFRDFLVIQIHPCKKCHPVLCSFCSAGSVYNDGHYNYCEKCKIEQQNYEPLFEGEEKE